MLPVVMLAGRDHAVRELAAAQRGMIGAILIDLGSRADDARDHRRASIAAANFSATHLLPACVR